MSKILFFIVTLVSSWAFVHAGNNRPYGVSVTGFQGSGTTGHNIGANGYAGRYATYRATDTCHVNYSIGQSSHFFAFVSIVL